MPSAGFYMVTFLDHPELPKNGNSEKLDELQAAQEGHGMRKQRLERGRLRIGNE
jgi:hypothetical protein